jgi:hypothetical protein
MLEDFERLTPRVAEHVARARKLGAAFAPYGHVNDPRHVSTAAHAPPTAQQWEEALYLLHSLAAWAEARHNASLEAARTAAILEAASVDA